MCWHTVQGSRCHPVKSATGSQSPRVATTENDSGRRPRSSGRTSRCPAHQSTGCSVTRSRRRPAPSSAVTISPSVQARANLSAGRHPRSTGGRCTRGPSPGTPRDRRSSRSRSGSSRRPRPRRTATRRVAVEDHEPPAGARRRRRTAAHGRGPASQMIAPRPVYRRSAVPSSSAGHRGRRPRPSVAGAPVASVSRRARSSIRGLKSTPDDLVRTEVQQRQRVPAAGALEVDRSTAPAVEVADEVLLDREQVEPPDRMSATASSNQPS